MFIGFSFGGLVAFEMAKQMRESGKDVRLVVLVDSTLSTAFKKTGVIKRVKEHYKSWRKQGAFYLKQNIVLKFYYSWKEKFTHWYLRKRLWYYKLTGKKSDMSVDLKEFDAWKENKEAARQYYPYSYAGKVILLKSDQTTSQVEYLMDPQLGWGDVVSGGVEIIKCPGNHLGMLADPFVETVAKKLMQSIKKALNKEIGT